MKRHTVLLLVAVVAAAAAPVAGQAAAASDVPANVPKNGLVAFWTGNGHAKDSAGKNHGKVAPGVTFTADRHGKAKSAFLFDGNKEVVTIPDSAALDTDDAFTLSVWINAKAYKSKSGSGCHIVDKWHEAAIHGDWALTLQPNGQLILHLCSGPRRGDTLYSKSVVPKNTWTHIAATFDRGAMKLYINGQLTAAKASAVVKRLDPVEYRYDDVRIGTNYRGIFSFNGAIDEVGIWNRALSGGEIAAVAGLPPEPPAYLPRKDLVAFWTADGHARDSAGKNHGTVGEGVTFTADRHGTAKGAFSFNGKSGFVTVPDSAALDTDDAFTLSAWIKPTACRAKTGKNGWIVSKWYSSPTHGDYILWLNGDGRVFFYVADVTKSMRSDDVSSNVVAPKDAWTHVAATFDRGAMHFYVNGKLVASKVSKTVKRTDPAEYSHDDVCIGAIWNNSYIFTGAIDDVGIWNRALSEAEIAAVAGPMAGMHVVRLAGVDRIEMSDSSVLKGTIQNKQYTVATPFGKLVIPAEKVVGILPAPKPKPVTTKPASNPAVTGPFVHLLLADGQVVTGQLSAQEILLAMDWRPALKIPIGKIRQCGYGISKAKPAEEAISGPMVTLRSGQQLILADKNLTIPFQTDWGKVALPIGSLLRIESADWQSERHRAILANGSVLTGTLAKKLKLKLALGGEVTVGSEQVWGITGRAKPVKAAGATMLLRGGDALIGRFADKMLTIKTASGNVKVHAGGIASMQFDAKKPTSVTLFTWDNKTIKGTVTDASVAFEIAPGGPALKIPVAKIATITQPDASPPPELLQRIEKLIAQLGAESYLDREKAQKALIAMGKSIAGILKKHLNNPDLEIRQRLEQIIKALGG